MDCAAASTAPRYTVIQSYPYNPSSNSALIFTSYKDDIFKSSYMFELALHAVGHFSAAAKSLVDLQLTVGVVLCH